jgi:hypothetical protein
MDWKITDVISKDGVIESVKYYIKAEDGENCVETEGYWHFDCPTAKVPFEEVTEQLIVKWVEEDAQKDGKCHITERLLEQLEELKKIKHTSPPWMPQTFSIGQ